MIIQCFDTDICTRQVSNQKHLAAAIPKVTLEKLCTLGFNCDDYRTEKNDSSRSKTSTQQVLVVVEVAAAAGSRSRKWNDRHKCIQIVFC